MKIRLGQSGVHLFERSTGINILLDEARVPKALWHKAPRFLSVALTNVCNLHCGYCYAPKHKAQLDKGILLNWLVEFDANGGLSVGFGGGEPTLYPHFHSLCNEVHRETSLGITFTTHAHQLTAPFLESIVESVQFVRVSVDGVHRTYEELRGRSFESLIKKIELLRRFLPFGVNVVVNERTIAELGDVADYAAELGASEVLLLPEIDKDLSRDLAVVGRLKDWVASYTGPLKLCMSEDSSSGFPVCDPFADDQPLDGYAHLDASGFLRSTSFSNEGVAIGSGGFLSAFEKLGP